jgi:type IV secretion system protein VirB9
MLSSNRTSRALVVKLGAAAMLVAPVAGAHPKSPPMPVPYVDALNHSASPSRQSAPAAARRSPDSGHAPDPRNHVGAANRAARVEPEVTGFENAIQRYPWREGALYQVYAAPGQVTDITLQEGERLVGPGPVAAGDTVRWMIGDTLSGSGAAARLHILVKPTRPDISTNLVINTDRRTYHLELRATPRTWMASVSWTYPADELIALRQAAEVAALAEPVADGFALEQLNFDYRIEGDRPDWRPIRIFDDGRRTLVEFPSAIAQSEMPPFFIIGEGGTAELANYRVTGRYLIVDRLFAKAELRLGAGRRQQRVRLVNRARSGS